MLVCVCDFRVRIRVWVELVFLFCVGEEFRFFWMVGRGWKLGEIGFWRVRRGFGK